MARTGIVPLSDVLELHLDEVPIDRTLEYRTAGVRSYGRGLFARPVVSGATSSYSKLLRLHTDDVVLSRLFAWEGAVALVPLQFEGWFVSPEFPTFEVDADRVLPGLIGHFVSWGRFHQDLASSTRGLGQRRQRVHVEEFLNLTIPLPPMDEQRRLLARLDRVASHVVRVQALHRSATDLAGALAVSASTRPDLDERARRRAGWRRSALGEFLVPSTRQVSVDAADQYRIAGIYSFGRGLIDRGEISGSDTSYKTLTVLDEGDVVVSKLNGWEGAVAVVDRTFLGHCVSSEYPTFKPDPAQVRPAFFRGIARSTLFWDALNRNARGSMVRRRRINSTEFLATEVWLPPVPDQAQIAAWLNTLDQGSIVRAESAARIEALLPAALNEAFVGLS